jgi:hypothetical protein
VHLDYYKRCSMIVVSGVETGPAAIFAVSRNAAFGVIEISAWLAKAHRSMLRTNLVRRRFDVVSL